MTRPAVLLFLFLLALPPVTAEAQSRRRRTVPQPTRLKSKLSNVRAEKNRLRQELKRTKAAAVEVKESIHVVDARLERIEDELDRTTSRLSDNQSEQRALSRRLEDMNKRLAQVREQVRKRLRRMYLRNEGGYVSALVGTNNVSDLLARQQIAEAIVRRDRRMFDEYRRIMADVAMRKRRKDRLVAEIRDLKGRQVQHHNRLEDTRSDKKELLDDLRSKQERIRRAIAQFEADEASIISQIAAYARRPRRPGSRPLPAMVGRFLRPANGPITSGFGMRYHPILNYRRMHKGVDIGAPSGSPIYAAADGEVISARYSSSYGNVIILAHGGGLTTVYAHCSRISVSVGQSVRRGQRIGSVGATGLAKGAHLHWEVYQNGRAVNPLGR
ncbi:MAG: murein hydrolase activator EnvC family protein [Fimbriimonas sp.]